MVVNSSITPSSAISYSSEIPGHCDHSRISCCLETSRLGCILCLTVNKSTTPYPENQEMSSKLRKSCDLCAFTKVGCTKEKPVCARCAKRKQTCVYSTAKRAGRTSGGRDLRGSKEMTPISPNLDLETAQSLGNTTASPTTPSAVAILSPSSPEFSRPQCSLTHHDIFQTLTSSTGDTLLSSMPSDSFTEWDELFASAPVSSLGNPLDGDPSGASVFDFPGLEDFSDQNSSTDHSNSSSSSRSNSDSSTFTDISSQSSGSRLFPGSSKPNVNVVPTLKAAIAPVSPNNSLIVARPHLGDAHIPDTTTNGSQAGKKSLQSESTSCECLARVLGLLAQLCPATSEWWAKFDNSDDHLSSFEHIVAQNEQTSEVIEGVLQCSCSNDSYLLVMLSLIVFKIIAWYTAAARAVSGEEPVPGRGTSHSNSGSSALCWQSSHHQQHPNRPFEPQRKMFSILSSTSSSSSSTDNNNNNNHRSFECDSEGEDQQRIAVQRILSKLAGVQVSVDELSDRLGKIWDNKPSKNNKSGDEDKTMMDPSLPLPVSGAASSCGSTAGCSLAVEENAFTRPYSAEFAYTLQVDLRKRLYELSQAIVEKLRGG